MELGADAASVEAARFAFLTVCNLLTRLGEFAPCIELALPSGLDSVVSRVYARTRSLEDQALWTLTAMFPAAGLVRTTADRSHTYDLALSIGTPVVSARRRLAISWTGWQARVVESSTGGAAMQPDSNLFGAAVAAALGVARLHLLQLQLAGLPIETSDSDWTLNALTLSDRQEGPTWNASNEFHIPRTLLVGAGALGSCLVYLLSHITNIRSSFDVIDYDFITSTNANRHITTTFDVARRETERKALDLARVWPLIRPMCDTYAGLKSTRARGAGDYDIAISAVDNADIRHEMATDLPRALINGATGGLMISVMRGEDPANSCIACEYAPVVIDPDAEWARKLGTSHSRVKELRERRASITEADIESIKNSGTIVLQDSEISALLVGGWDVLQKAACGFAHIDRSLPSASVSYVSALCGFLMATQVVAHAMGVSTLSTDHPLWQWEDVLRIAPQRSQLLRGRKSAACTERHAMRSRLYAGRWPAA